VGEVAKRGERREVSRCTGANGGKGKDSRKKMEEIRVNNKFTDKGGDKLERDRWQRVGSLPTHTRGKKGGSEKKPGRMRKLLGAKKKKPGEQIQKIAKSPMKKELGDHRQARVTCR